MANPTNNQYNITLLKYLSAEYSSGEGFARRQHSGGECLAHCQRSGDQCRTVKESGVVTDFGKVCRELRLLVYYELSI